MKTLAIFDLEATCWENGVDDFGYEIDKKVHEIIEIGAVRISRDTGEIINEFDIFVKPELHPYLSRFCRQLTSITQENVNSGCSFADATKQFNDWLDQYDDDYILAWGYYDRNQLIRESNNKAVDMIELETKLMRKYLNMKNQFAHVFNTKPGGLVKALNRLHLPFDGTHHRGIDDSKNIARIYKEVRDGFFDKIYDAD